MFIFDISFNIGIKIVRPGSCSARSYPESPLHVGFKLSSLPFPPSFKHTEYSAHLLRRSNVYLFRKSTCTRSTLTKLPISKLQREQHINFNLHVYFDVIASQAQATPSAMATYNYSFQMYLPRAAFLKSMVFSVRIRRFKVRGVVYSY